MGNFKIREFRKAKGLYQDEFAGLIGLTQSNLSRYETNEIDLSDEQLAKLIDRFGKESVDAFRTDSSEMLRDKNDPAAKIESIAYLDLVSIIKKQNDTICQQMQLQNQFTTQLTNMNEKLISLLEKITIN